jgi:hypothetical protein
LPSTRTLLPRLVLVLALFGSWIAGACPGAAQTSAPALGPDGSVGARVGTWVGLGTVKGRIGPQAGGRVAIDLLPWLRAGGEGMVILDGPRVSPGDAPDDSELRLGYGGVLLEVGRRRLEGADPWSLGLLLGAGMARIRSPTLGSELDSQNFFLLEPSLARRIRLRGPVLVEGRMAYRLPLNAQPMVGVRPGDLRGGSVRLTLSLVRSP